MRLLAFIILISCSTQKLHIKNRKIASNDFLAAVIGDYGVDDQNQLAVSNLVKSKSPDFIFTLGDNNYPDGCLETIDRNIGKYYFEYIYNYQGSYGYNNLQSQKFFPSLGNHDWNAKKEGKCNEDHDPIPYIKWFDLPGNEQYYDFIKGEVHFFVLDSDPNQPDGNSYNSTQGKWFQQKIKESKSLYKVVYFHHPPYSSGLHLDTNYMKYPFSTLGVDLVLSGHDHHYERSYIDDVTYLVVGNSGTALRPAAREIPAYTKKFYSEKHGAGFLEYKENKLYFKLINIENEIIDSFVISKSPSDIKGNQILKKPRASLKLYPNPVSAATTFNLKINLLEDCKKIDIINLNISGQRISKLSFIDKYKGSFNIQLEAPLQKGSYLVNANLSQCGPEATKSDNQIIKYQVI